MANLSKRIKTKVKYIKRCSWVTEDPIYIKYHDEEWGKAEYDGQKIFEMLCLEGQQAGLSWVTILKKREIYRQLFLNFNPYEISKFTDEDVSRLLSESGIVKHKGKIEAIINNSKCYIEMEKNCEDFSKFVWGCAHHVPVINNWSSNVEVPSETSESIALSKALKLRGFKFVGSRICYALMQACGIVNDHVMDCSFK